MIDLVSGNNRKETGRLGEDLACGHLEGEGFSIEERNLRTRQGEIDIVARKGDLLVFAEVKTRRSREFGEPEESVTPEKARRIRRLAARYLSERHGPSLDIRFDVIGVVLGADGSLSEIRHLEGVF